MARTAETTTIEFITSDGVTLVGDLARPAEVWAAAIVCHPHPEHGGNRHNNVVDALFTALPAAGIAAFRFDFRSKYDHGRGESLDAVAAIDVLRAAIADAPLIATGYSFGAAVALGLDDLRITGKVLVAPPLAAMGTTPGMDVQTLVLTPAHDQFSPPEETGPIIAGWTDVSHETIESADHFLAGRAGAVAEMAVAWILSLCSTSTATD